MSFEKESNVPTESADTSKENAVSFNFSFRVQLPVIAVVGITVGLVGLALFLFL